jgi:hypothetical protein
VDLTHGYERVVPEDLRQRYAFRETRNAGLILAATNPTEFDEVIEVLADFRLRPPDIVEPGGNKSLVAARLDEEFRRRGWREGRHDTTITAVLSVMPYRPAGESTPIVTETQVFNEGYKVDNVKGRVALDVEWNAKDGNLDRDLGAYRALYDAGVIDGAVMITRTQEDIRSLATRLGVRRFDTTTTTNLGKLEPRMTRGDVGGCPLLVVAITVDCFEP